jgi:hypothetical protein
MRPDLIVHVVVTEDHITRGQQLDSSQCPLALALADLAAFEPDSLLVEPWSVEGRVWDGTGWYPARAWLPAVARRFVDLFDRGRRPAPIDFDLAINFVEG